MSVVMPSASLLVFKHRPVRKSRGSSSVWLSAHPVKFSGFISASSCSFVMLKSGSAAILSSRSLSAPSSLTRPAGSHGMLSDLFVEHLSVSAGLHGIHHDIFRSHERKLAHQSRIYHLRVNDEA